LDLLKFNDLKNLSLHVHELVQEYVIIFKLGLFNNQS